VAGTAARQNKYMSTVSNVHDATFSLLDSCITSKIIMNSKNSSVECENRTETQKKILDDYQ